jgi:YggT family protein
MGLVLAIVAFLLLLFQLLLIARAILDWVTIASPPTHGSVRARITAGIHALTEPVLAPVRKVVPPLRVGGVALDLSFLVVFLAVLLLRQLVLSL